MECRGGEFRYNCDVKTKRFFASLRKAKEKIDPQKNNTEDLLENA
jgi:hypothetical protein